MHMDKISLFSSFTFIVIIELCIIHRTSSYTQMTYLANLMMFSLIIFNFFLGGGMFHVNFVLIAKARVLNQ